MYHFFEAITNTSGQSLIGYFGRVINVTTGATVTMASDENGTPIATVSGVADMAKTDAQGNLDFYVAPGTYHLDIYAPNATSFNRRVANVAMNSTKGDQGDPGPPGPADAFRATLADLKAADITDGKSDYDGSTWFWTTGNFTGQADDINIVKANSTALTTGAWVRQSAAKVTFKAAGTGSALRPVDAKAGERLSPADKTGALQTQLGSHATDYPLGARIDLGRGTIALTDTFTHSGQRLRIAGDAVNATQINFTKAGGGTAIKFDTAGLGGNYQSSVENVGFVAPGTDSKIAIHAKNASGLMLRNIGLPSAWLGADSIGLLLQGRESVWLTGEQGQVACARPLVIRKNPTWPTLNCDHSGVDGQFLIGTSSNYYAVEFEEGAIPSNFTITKSGVVGGQGGVKARNSTEPGNGNNFAMTDGRSEQHLDPASWNVDWDYTGGGKLRHFFASNWLYDALVKGVRLRNVQHINFIGCGLPQADGRAAIDATLLPGGELVMLGCEGQAGGTKVVTNGHPLIDIPSTIANNPVGSFELWSYFVTPADQTDGSTAIDYGPLPIHREGGVERAAFRRSFGALSTANRLLNLPLISGATIDVDVTVRVANGRLELTRKVDGSFVVRNSYGLCAATSTAGKIYWGTDQLVLDHVASAVTISVEISR